MWDDDLRVAFCAQSTAFEQWLFVPYALLVNVLSGFDVIDSVDNEIQSSPEVIIEILFIFLSDSQLNAFESRVGIHFSSDSTCSLTLVLTNMLLSEQELSVQVTDFNIVIISDINFTITSSWSTHQGKHFNELASKGTSANNKWAWVLAFLNKFVSEKNCVIVVPVLSVGSFFGTFSGKHFEEFVVEPLSQWSVLACKFDDFLGDDAAPEWTVGRNLGLSVSGDVLDQVLVDSFDFEVFAFNLHFFIFVVVNQLNQLLGFGFVENSGKPLVFGPEVINTVQDQVELFWDSEFFPTGNWHFHWIWRVRVSETLFEVVEFHVDRHFGFDAHAAVFVDWEFGSVSDEETTWSLDFDFELHSIDLSHSLDFLELNCISIIEPVPLIFMEINCGFFFPSDTGKVDQFRLFTSQIKDSVCFSEVNKSVSIQTKVSGQDKTDFMVSAGFVEFDEVFSIVIVANNDTFEVVGAELK
jgi:hypothetical protein